MNNSNLSTCKVCQNIKERIDAGKFPNGKSTRYIDSKGKQWMGRTCPDCHKMKVAIHIRNKRNGS